MELIKRPWGFYEVLKREPMIWIKCVNVNPGQRLSLQTHSKRNEKWIIIQGVGIVNLGEKNFSIKKEDTIDVPKGIVHRIANTGKEILIFVEVAFGEYLSEDDIVRLEDDYYR